MGRPSIRPCIRLFLSTPSARRATRKRRINHPGLGNFYPRPPRGGRQRLHRQRAGGSAISIHALREEGDLHSPAAMVLDRTIYIHALREEGDMAVLAECCCSTYFYPRPPRGGRRERIIFAPAIDRFLSTPSARRATPKNKKSPDAPNDFYTRPPRGGRPKARP